MNKLFTLLSAVMFFTLQAQNHVHNQWCGTEISHEWMEEFYQRDRSHLNKRTLERREIPIIYHILGTDAGTGYYTLQNLLRLHCDFQSAMLPANIHFWVKEINYINNTSFYNGNSTNQLFNQYNNLDVLNIYIVATMTGVCGYSYVPAPPSRPLFGNAGPNRGGIMLAANCLGIGSTTLIHEAGHYFNLPHTFFGWENQNAPVPSQPAPANIGGGFFGSQVERVDGTNCLTAGDGFCDTPPDYLSQRWTCTAAGTSNVSYTDPAGVSFLIDGKNYMSYSNDACTELFSTDQLREMNNTPTTHRSYLLNLPAPDMTPLEATEVVFPDNIQRISLGVEVNLQWKRVDRAEFYLVQVSANNSFFNLLYNEIVTDTFFTLPSLLSNRSYIWRVRPFSYNVMCSDFTSEARFSTSNFSATADLVNESCFGFSDGSATLNTTGVTGNLAYRWNATDPFLNSQLSINFTDQALNLPAGNYIATVIRNLNDTARIPFTIVSNPEISLDLYQFGTSLFATVTGGTPPFTYVWSNGSTSREETNPVDGSNELLIIDATGCRKTGTVNFNPAAVNIANISSLVDFTLYPNPSSDSNFNIDFELSSNELVHVDVVNIAGQHMLHKHFDLGAGKSTVSINVPNASKGVYFVKVSMGDVVKVKKVTLL